MCEDHLDSWSVGMTGGSPLQVQPVRATVQEDSAFRFADLGFQGWSCVIQDSPEDQDDA